MNRDPSAQPNPEEQERLVESAQILLDEWHNYRDSYDQNHPESFDQEAFRLPYVIEERVETELTLGSYRVNPHYEIEVHHTVSEQGYELLTSELIKLSQPESSIDSVGDFAVSIIADATGQVSEAECMAVDDWEDLYELGYKIRAARILLENDSETGADHE
jgi:hypothetical protein